MRLVFMGTPDFAVPSLKRLLTGPHQIVGVVTQPDRPKGRGRKMCASAVKEIAIAAGVPVFQPDSLIDSGFLSTLEAMKADCFVVVAFRILPSVIFNMPPKGTFNLHTSMLPKYRGAAPMQWALMNGEKETGLTTFLLDDKIDTGRILLQEKVEIGDEEILGELHDRMAILGAELVQRTVTGLETGLLSPKTQSGESSSAPKIRSEHTYIDWRWPADKIVNRIRGLSPSPAAVTLWNGKRLKFYRARVVPDQPDHPGNPGGLVSVSSDGIVVQTGAGVVQITELQLEGRKRMDTDAFLRGCALKVGDQFRTAEEGHAK